MKKITICSLAFLMLLAGCASTNTEKTFVQGMIYNSDNEAVSDAEIYLDDEEITVSDIYGHFTLDQLTLNKDYVLTAKKKGYEDSNLTFRFLNASQVIYLKMYSAGELLAEAEKKASEREYGEALHFIERAECTNASKMSTDYLKAIIYFQRQEYDRALDIAEGLLDEGFTDPYVYLLLADIYEKGFGNVEKTEEYLEQFLKLSYDPAIKMRLSK